MVVSRIFRTFVWATLSFVSVGVISSTREAGV